MHCEQPTALEGQTESLFFQGPFPVLRPNLSLDMPVGGSAIMTCLIGFLVPIFRWECFNVIKILYSLFALVAASSVAYAHAKMMSSVPENGSHVAAGLSQIKFTFSKSMRLTMVKVRQEQSQLAIAPTEDLPANFITSATIKIPPLEAGMYSVEWTAVATDGHVMTGAIDFIVDVDATAPPE